MQFQVPQFIDVEDKIFGDFTLFQFIYMAGGGGFAAMMIFLLPLYVAIIVSLPVVGLSAALAFYKVNNRPFVDHLQSMLAFYFNNNLYIWKPKDAIAIARSQQQAAKTSSAKTEPAQVVSTSAARNRLKDLAWSLDIKESSIYSDKKQR